MRNWFDEFITLLNPRRREAAYYAAYEVLQREMPDELDSGPREVLRAVREWRSWVAKQRDPFVRYAYNEWLTYYYEHNALEEIRDRRRKMRTQEILKSFPQK